MITKIYYDIASAILSIDANAKVKVSNEDIDNIEWTSSEISKSEILAKQAELKTADDALAYARSRVAEYPSIEEQLDKIYNDGVDAWKVVIKATKDKYPKG
tara:strand:+ start:1693 stop:1995 length:303 start_codon:yes stop_codon:yes gene_type:complete